MLRTGAVGTEAGWRRLIKEGWAAVLNLFGF